MLHILLTNDDGIHADGLWALHKELKKFAKVSVVAPDYERSSISHAITLRDPIRVFPINKNGRFFGHAVNGTPADCVKIGLDVVLKGKAPDLIISGINHGTNDGCSVHYSGTVAAAREGALNKIPSMAVSLATFAEAKFEVAAKIMAKIAKSFDLAKIPDNTFLNINIPYLKKKDIKGIRVLKQGRIPIHSKFHKKTDQYGYTYYWLGAEGSKNRSNNQYDTSALYNGYVTIVPVKTDTTDYDALDYLTTMTINT